eukprot:TRINITY_DN19894_c0_g1_i1.p1 TRINITY_DN19894_c0_g1~~TRINITY_DN19894_c0_g1_i1.p1  ORF type:complete len:554 (+),score=150.15 TRINITY_DN19894_c0_g1_i1:62-1723(+)
MAFPTSSKIENNILYPVEKTNPPDLSTFQDKPFGEYLLDSVRNDLQEKGDRPWLTNGAIQATGSSQVFGEETVMISDLEPKSRQIAKILHHVYNVGRGDVVHIMLPNTSQYYFPVFGTWILQGVVSPADPGLSPQVLARQLEDAGTKVIFCCQSTLGKVMSARKELEKEIPIVVFDIEEDNTEESVKSLKSLLKLEFPDPPAHSTVDKNERTLICWSSGTTGRPKGIQHGSNLWTKILTEKPQVTKGLQTTCMFHMGGFYNPISNLIRGGSTVFLAEEDLEIDDKMILNAAAKASPDSLVCGTHHAVQLASLDPKLSNTVTSVKTIWPLGANVYDGICEDLRGKFPNLMFVGNVLAQSEIFTAVAVSFNQKHLGGLYSAMEALKFVDPETGEAVGPNTEGEFAVKISYSMMLGYLNHKEENDHFFGKDGFFYLGDFGHYDDNGVIYYDGRKKDLIKYKNSHLYPKEIEDLIMKNPNVEDVAVFGKPEPSVQELVTAVVVVAKGSNVTGEEIMTQVEENVDDHKKLRGGVYFVDKIPRNPQGKILRRNLLKLIS